MLVVLREINANLESARAASPDADRLERLLRDISAKLDGARAAAPDAEVLENLLRDISLKIEGARAGAPDARLLEPLDGGTRVTLRHTGFTSPETCTNTAIGWETSFARLAQCLADGEQARR